MIEIDIPGRGLFKFETLVLDVNGTITTDGTIIDGVRERIRSLRETIEIFMITADTLGNASALAESLGIQVWIIEPDDENAQKLNFIKECGSETTAAIGNGANDTLMLNGAALGICVAGHEGASVDAVQNCDILVTDINSALDLLLKPKRLIATLRK